MILRVHGPLAGKHWCRILPDLLVVELPVTLAPFPLPVEVLPRFRTRFPFLVPALLTRRVLTLFKGESTML